MVDEEKMRRDITNTLLILLLLLTVTFVISSSSISANGGVLSPDYERIVFLPEQKAVIFWDGTNETMILSTKINSDNISNMAWIIPIPSKSNPEVSEGDIEVFDELSFDFGTWVGGDRYFYLPVELCSISVLFLIIGFICLIFILKKEEKKSKIVMGISVLFIVLSLSLGFYSCTFFLIGGTDQVFDVDVIEFTKVDIYDIAIIKATNASDVVQWSQANDFIVPPSVIPILDEYCNQSNFYFIINKINLSNVYTTPDEIQIATEKLQKGIETPLQITFQPEQPFFPMKMSSINKGDTSINVYFISDNSYMDYSGLLIPQEVRNAGHGPIIPSYNSGDVITLLTYQGNTEDLTEDSYFI